MPEEIMIISVVALIASAVTLIAITKLLVGYFQSKSSTRLKGEPESSLTTSELQRLMRQAVEEALRPLTQKVEALEQRLDAGPKQLEAPASSDLLKDVETFEAEASPQPARRRHQARQ